MSQFRTSTILTSDQDLEPTTVNPGALALTAKIFAKDHGPHALAALLHITAGVLRVDEVPSAMAFQVHTALLTENAKHTKALKLQKRAFANLRGKAKTKVRR